MSGECSNCHWIDELYICTNCRKEYCGLCMEHVIPGGSPVCKDCNESLRNRIGKGE